MDVPGVLGLQSGSESQQGGAVQGRGLGLWDLSDPVVMSLPGKGSVITAGHGTI